TIPTTYHSPSTPPPDPSRARQPGRCSSISPLPLRAVLAVRPSSSPMTAAPPRRRSQSPSKRGCSFYTSTATTACW
ncbi:hypothetical protein CORC01_01214, partial [Colletotrichum orchidophilum]